MSREAGFWVDQMLWLMAGWEVSTVSFFFPSLGLQSSSLDESLCRVLGCNSDGWVKSDIGSWQVATGLLEKVLSRTILAEKSWGDSVSLVQLPAKIPDCPSRHSGFPVHMKVNFPFTLLNL